MGVSKIKHIKIWIRYGQHVLYANLGESFVLLIQCKEAKSNRFDENVLCKK